MCASTYDIYGGLQKEVAGELISQIVSPCPPRAVLDIGCGTGFLTIETGRKFPDAEIFGCDFAHPMVKTSFQKLSYKENSFFTTGDCEDLPYRKDSFDLAVSNLALQWTDDINRVFSETLRVLKKDGRFIFSTLGKRSLNELKESYKKAHEKSLKDGLPSFVEFLDKKRLRSAMHECGFADICVVSCMKKRRYPDMWALLKTLKGIGAGNPRLDGDKSLARGRILKNMAKLYTLLYGTGDINRQTRDIYATYEVIIVHGRKNA